MNWRSELKKPIKHENDQEWCPWHVFVHFSRENIVLITLNLGLRAIGCMLDMGHPDEKITIKMACEWRPFDLVIVQISKLL